MNLFEQLGELYKSGFTPAQVQSIIKIMGTGTSTGTAAGTGTNTNTPTNTPTTTPGAPSATVPTPGAPSATGHNSTTSAPTTSGHQYTNIQPQPAEKNPETNAEKSGSVPGSIPGTPEKSEQSETVALLKEMLGLIQKGNINQMTGTSNAPTDGAEVLASILNPTTKLKGEFFNGK